MFDLTNNVNEQHTKLHERTHWRVVYTDGTFEEKPENYKNIDRKRVETFLIIDDETGTELLNIPVPKDCQVVARRRSNSSPNGVERMWVVGLIKLIGVKQKIQNQNATDADGNPQMIWDYNQFSQKLFFLHPDGHVDIEEDADEFQKYGKIRDLRDEEVG